MTVQLPEPFAEISEIRFDWAQAPPRSYAVTFSNSSSLAAAVNVTSDASVAVSDAYDASKVSDIVPYSGNTTNVTLERPVWSVMHATLTILRNRATGRTADEFNGTGVTMAD